MSERLKLAARLLAWIGAAAIAAATLVPIGLRPITTLPVSIERVAAWCLAGLLFAIGYPNRRGVTIVGLVAAAAILEAAQNIVGSRHGRVPDFLVKAAAALVGVSLGMAVERWARTRAACGRPPARVPDSGR